MDWNRVRAERVQHEHGIPRARFFRESEACVAKDDRRLDRAITREREVLFVAGDRLYMGVDLEHAPRLPRLRVAQQRSSPEPHGGDVSAGEAIVQRREELAGRTI